MNPLVHEGMFHRDESSYLDGTLPFIHDALARGAPTMVAVPRHHGELIRRELGRSADRIQLNDISIDGRNPGRIIPAVLRAFADEHAGQPIAIIGEPIWPGRSEHEYPACVQHEALINAVFAGVDAAILCPYDIRRLEPEVLADAARTHPVLVTDGQKRPSASYTDPADVIASLNRPLPPPPPDVAVLPFGGAVDLIAVREFVGAHAKQAGLVHDRVIDLEMVANELVTNTIRHAGGTGVLRVWDQDGHVMCDVTDGGHITDLLVGRLPPPVNSESGRGLLLVNHLCDLVRIHTVPGLTSVRAYVRLF